MTTYGSTAPSRRARAGRYFESPTYGVPVPVGSVDQLTDLCRALVRGLPGPAVFTHVTAAAVRGRALPDRVHLELPVIAGSGAPAPHLDRRGVYVRRCTLGADDVAMACGGVPVASSAQTVRELAEDLSLVDLVVALDSAVQCGDLSDDDLAALVRPRRRGRVVLQQALGLVDGRAESGWESLLRLVHQLSGILDVEPQQVLTDEWDQPVARADLWLRGTRRLHEYDGGHHADPQQQRADRARDNALARSGYDRRAYTRPAITRRPGLIVRDAEDALGLPHDPGRVRGWLAEFQRSSYSAAGQRRLHRRLQRFRRPLPPQLRRRVAQE